MIKYCLRYYLAGIISLVALTLNGQGFIKNDTVKIQEVTIRRDHIIQDHPGFKKIIIDSSLIIKYSLFSMAEVLNEITQLNLRCYGLGGSSTVAFRGSSSGHTLVLWNGINLNSPMLGQSDFSILPAGMIDNVQISYGSASMEVGDGAIGGAIVLENRPTWKKQTSIDIKAGTGSFGRYSSIVRVEAGNEHFQTITKAFLQSSRNDFSFLDTVAAEPVWKKREQNQMSQKGFMQEFYLRKKENILSARIWYQYALRHLPGSLDYGNQQESQTDESFRSLINYDFINKSSEYSFSAAWMYSKLNYSNELYSIESDNLAKTLVLKGGISTPIGRFTKVRFILNEELNGIVTNNYLENLKRNNASFTLSAERKTGDRVGAVVLLRETIDGQKILVPDFSAGLEYRIVRGVDHFLKLNISRNSKIPSLNDRYWNPGGNPDLKNEYAFSGELGYKFDQRISSGISAGSELNFYRNFIRDMIQWHEGSSWYWVADNIGKVNSSGIESMFYAKYSKNYFAIYLNAGYTFTRASEIDPQTSEPTGNQLVYVPKNQAKGSLQFSWKNIYSAWLTNYTGRIYRDSDNQQHLPPFTLNNFITGTKFNFIGAHVDLQFRVENIFDITYQTIAYYPQPGRSYFLTLSLRLKNSK
jgi:outer membrane cobalamin receptor